MTFGDILKKRRILVGLSVPDLANRLGLKPSDLNRIERGVQAPEKSDKFLCALTDALLIDKTGPDYVQFASALNSADVQPRSLLCDADLLTRLPISFRTRDNHILADSQLKRLAEKLRYEFS